MDAAGERLGGPGIRNRKAESIQLPPPLAPRSRLRPPARGRGAFFTQTHPRPRCQSHSLAAGEETALRRFP
jgi:hypothetical protein